MNKGPLLLRDLMLSIIVSSFFHYLPLLDWTLKKSAYSLMKPVFVEQESDSIQIPSPPSHGHMLHSKETGLFLRSGGQAWWWKTIRDTHPFSNDAGMGRQSHSGQSDVKSSARELLGKASLQVKDESRHSSSLDIALATADFLNSKRKLLNFLVAIWSQWASLQLLSAKSIAMRTLSGGTGNPTQTRWFYSPRQRPSTTTLPCL